MATSRWTEGLLDEASKQGDNPSVHPNADDLAAGVMSHEGGVHGYNHLLEVADALLAAPSLALTDSALRRHLEEFSPEALRYFEPSPAPDWVDEAKLKAASALWEDNSVAVIAVLYALSLPCTYLYKKGVPALYETGKLTQHEYIFQRIHETGLFIDDVMSLGGIEVLKDYVPDEEELYLDTLRELDRQGDWQRAPHGGFNRGAGESPDSSGLAARVQQEVAGRRQAKRFLWGLGFLTARKVRFLHASIRFMLLNPEKLHPQARTDDNLQTLTDRLSGAHARWDKQTNGVPINQEELAFGLLSFGYLIPMGLEQWGCHISREEKDAFLHLWRVVGHVMGIREDLMTEDWDEATDLLALVMKRQAGPSDFGKHLTVALMDFLRSYFPHVSTGLRRRLPAHMIVDQLGRMNSAYPAMVLPADVLKDTTRTAPRAVFSLLMLWVRFYYLIRDRFVGRIPLVGKMLLSALHRASEELIDSWRDQFRRRPFDVSGSMAWIRRRGADKESEARLQGWRRKMFNNLAFAIACLFVMVALLAGAGVAAVVPSSLLTEKWTLAKVLGLGSLLCGFVAWAWMKWRMHSVFESRPR